MTNRLTKKAVKNRPISTSSNSKRQYAFTGFVAVDGTIPAGRACGFIRGAMRSWMLWDNCCTEGEEKKQNFSPLAEMKTNVLYLCMDEKAFPRFSDQEFCYEVGSVYTYYALFTHNGIRHSAATFFQTTDRSSGECRFHGFFPGWKIHSLLFV
jgi:hypothetical protein